MKEKDIKYLTNNPWANTLKRIASRCSPTQSYGIKGIKNYLHTSDLKFLWFRDKAFLMQKPTIDRIDSKGNYTLDNSRYLEFSKNIGRFEREKTHCKYGHEFSKENTWINRLGHRYCKSCTKRRNDMRPSRAKEGENG